MAAAITTYTPITPSLQQIANIAPAEISETSPNPGALNFFVFPFELIKNIWAWITACRKGDKEATWDAAIHVAASPVSLLQSGLALGTHLFQWASTLGITLFPKELLMVPAIPIAGIALCGFEGIYEGICIQRQLELLSQLDAFPHNTSQAALRKITMIEENYLFLNQKEIETINELVRRKFEQNPSMDTQSVFNQLALEAVTVKNNNLARRIKPWFVQELHRKIAPLKKELQSTDLQVRSAALTKAEHLFECMDIQCRKKLVIHLIALVALTLMALGFAFSFFLPPLVPAILLVVSGVIGTAKYFLSQGMLNAPGWGFSWKHCIPEWIHRYVLCGALNLQEPSLDGV